MRRMIIRAMVLLSALPCTLVIAQLQSSRVNVPAGTRLLVRMVDSVDSSRNGAGYRFTAKLETNLQADDMTVAPRGATIYGRLVAAKSAGRMAGGAGLTLELTDIVVNGTAYPLLTSLVDARSQGEGGRTTGRVVGGAGLGALIGGIAAGGRGAAIGAAAGGATGTVAAASTSGKQIFIPSETLLEFRLMQPASLPLAR